MSMYFRAHSVSVCFERDIATGYARLQSVLAALDRKITSCQSKSRGFHRVHSTAVSDEEKDMWENWAPWFQVGIRLLVHVVIVHQG